MRNTKCVAEQNDKPFPRSKAEWFIFYCLCSKYTMMNTKAKLRCWLALLILVYWSKKAFIGGKNITGSFLQIYVMLLPVYFYEFMHSLIQASIYQQSLL